MSNSLAIAAVTTTLQNLIYQATRDELGSGIVTTLPLDKARNHGENNQINLFLYHTNPNIAWLNHNPVNQKRRGETNKSPLGLELYYLISVYGEKDNEVKSHKLLGKVMSLFHDLTKLTPEIIETATSKELRESDLHHQVEKIHITPLSLTFEELAKIWQGFQAQYRLSIAYQVSVILIDSLLPLSVSMPVIAQGNGKSLSVQLGYYPTLQAIELPNRQPSAQLGDTITLRGNNLEQEGIRIQLKHSQFHQIIAVESYILQNSQSIQFKLPDPQIETDKIYPWSVGLYTVSLIIPQEEDRERQSNSLPMTVTPRIVSLTPKIAQEGNISLRLTCVPPLHQRQKAILFLGDRSFPTRKRSSSEATWNTTLTCRIQEAKTGIYVVRLRVDGVDSLPIDFSTIPWQFDPHQQVRIECHTV